MVRPIRRSAESGEGTPASEATRDESTSILAFVDELAKFAAEQWLAGKLDHFPAVEELPPDDDDQ
jgi:hypothetical protein